MLIPYKIVNEMIIQLLLDKKWPIWCSQQCYLQLAWELPLTEFPYFVQAFAVMTKKDQV